MSKVDFKKELKHLYSPPKKFSVVDVPPMNFLMGDGRGDPNTSPDFQVITDALYGLAYTIKFAVKSRRDFVVPPLEGLWWMDDMTAFDPEAKDEWLWTLMIMQPEWVTAEVLEEAREEVGRKKDLPALADLGFDTYHEGLAVQIMYVGPYADEGPTIRRMHSFIEDEGYELAGKHHEIYLSDPRRTAPEKFKTVIRQPIRKV